MHTAKDLMVKSRVVGGSGLGATGMHKTHRALTQPSCDFGSKG